MTSDLLDLLRSLEWCAIAGPHGEDWNVCPECRSPEHDGKHIPTCRLAHAIRALTTPEPSPGEPTVDEMAREMGLTFHGDVGAWAYPGTGRTAVTRPLFASDGDYRWYIGSPVDGGQDESRGRFDTPDEALRTLYREHKARRPDPPSDEMERALGRPAPMPASQGGTVHPSLYSCGRTDCHDETYHKHESHQWSRDAASFPTEGEAIRLRWRAGTIAPEKPPTDPSALAAWLYARVVPGRTVAEYRWGEVMRRQAVVTEKGAAVDIDHVTIDILAGELLFTIPGSPKFVRLLNPDGTVLWEQK